MKKSSLFNEEKLRALGILDWGYTEEAIPQSLSRYEKWTDDSNHGPLSYLNDHRKELRRDLRHVFPEFQSALVFLFSYQEAKKWLLEEERYEVAGYTLGFEGEDYHRALKYRLDQVVAYLDAPGLKSFYSLDAQPILERDLAYRAGLGWFGKNSMLINRKEGSYFIIGSILLNQKLQLEETTPDVDHCGKCTACAEACPTNAIDVETRTINAPLCISTFTIEIFKDAEAPPGFDKSRGEIFGCDICQDICPWNRKPLSRVIGELKLKDSLSYLKEWLFIWPSSKLTSFIQNESNRSFRKKLFGTPFDRPGKEGWLKNLKARINSRRNDL